MPRTKKQLANDQRLKDKHKAKREAKEVVLPPEVKKVEESDSEVQHPRDLEKMQSQINEILRDNELLKQALTSKQTAQVTDRGIIGVTDRHNIDPNYYPDPTERLREEPRLTQFAFKENYELNYDFEITSYETKDGRFMQEPKFKLTLGYIVRDDQGEPTPERYVVKRCVFFEDPAAAIAVAREMGLTLDDTTSKLFLDEMRYQRVRHWLLDAFYPKKPQETAKMREIVVNGRVVETYQSSSESASSIPFNEMNGKKKLRG